jgi:serine/threonine-protein kinase
MNFGWARLREQAAAHLGLSPTPDGFSYLSPSQARGDIASEADDVWAVAAILFELLAGCRLRSGGSDLEVANRAAMQRAPSLHDSVPDAPQSCVELLERALNQESALRWSAEALATRCRELAASPAISALRCLVASPERISIVEITGSDGSLRETEPPPNRSQVAAMTLPDEATGTAEPEVASTGRGAGTYSTRGDERVETVRPKKLI